MNFEPNSHFFITGGTGLVGSHMLYQLSENYKIKALTRNPARCQFVKELFEFYDKDSAEKRWSNIEWVHGDLEDIPLLEEIIEPNDYVIHTAAFVSFRKKDFNDLLKINFEGTRNLVNVCLNKNIKKMLHLSSVSVFSKGVNGNQVTELNRWKDSPENSGYGVSKYLAEREVWRGFEEGLEGVIVNPTVILGPGRPTETSNKLFLNVFKGVKHYPPGANAVVGVEDVVNASLKLLNSDQNKEQFILNGRNLSYKDLMTNIAETAGKKGPSKPITKGMIRTAYALETFLKIFGRKGKLTKEMIRSMFNHVEFDGTKVEKAIGFEYTPYEKSVENAVKFYKERGIA